MELNDEIKKKEKQIYCEVFPEDEALTFSK